MPSNRWRENDCPELSGLALTSGRALGMKASQAMLDSYTALVSGVLIGLSDALQPAAAAEPGRPRKT
jgi:hypothetical protein